MKVQPQEKAFPRGGQKPGVIVPNKGKLELFRKDPGRKKKLKLKQKEKQKTQTKLKSKGKDVKVLKQSSAKLLNYKTITEGMLILGCVKEITEFALKVNLPGRIFGEIPITNISSSYTGVLQKLTSGNQMQPTSQLADMFRVGQFVVTKVMQVQQTTDNEVKVVLTTSPHEIHSNWAHGNVQAGLVMPAAVSSVEDHGYVMDLGIRGVRAFLKSKKARQYEEVWNNGNQLSVGQIVRCLVKKAVCSDTVTTVELSANPEKVAQADTDTSKVTMQTLTPGMLFTATVTHIVQFGVQVKFGKNEVGFVNEDHLNEPSSLLKDVSVGTEYPARVLYIQPLVKTVFLTLLDNVCPSHPLPSPFEVLNVGHVVDKAKIVRVSSNGVLLNLGDGLRGFVTPHNATESLKRDVETSLIEQLNSLYPAGSTHKCRVLGYDHMVQLYSCSLNKSAVEEKLFSISDCKPGKVVSCFIDSVKSSGMNVLLSSKTRRLVAFVPLLHMADVPLRHPEKKFKEGSKHKARVLQVRNNMVWLTLKPSLVSSSLPALCQYKNIKRELQYEGVVVLVTPQGLLVEFFNNVKGWVPTHALGQGTDGDSNPSRRFYVGQTVKCYVKDVNVANRRMTLSLAPSPRTAPRVRIGGAYDLEILSVGEDCLHVQVCEVPLRGIVPMHHLTDHPSLSKLLLATYKQGDIIPSAYCFTMQGKLVFSVQNSVVEFFKSKLGCHIASEGLDAVKEEVVIPCSIRTVNEKGMMLNAPIPGLRRPLWVSRKFVSLVEEDFPSLGLVPHQVLMARISRADSGNIAFKASVKLAHCWDFDLEAGILLMESYLADKNRILAHLAQQNDPLAKLSPGNMVEGVVKTVTEIGAVVELPDGIQGVVMPHHYQRMELKPGDEVKGMILLVDVTNHCVQLTLVSGIMARVNKIQDGIIRGGVGVGMCLRGETMVANPYQVVVSLKADGRLQLASIPVRCHLNDFHPVTPLHELGAVSKIYIRVVGGGIIIGLPKVLIKINSKRRAQYLVNKAEAERSKGNVSNRKTSESETDEAYLSGIDATTAAESQATNSRKRRGTTAEEQTYETDEEETSELKPKKLKHKESLNSDDLGASEEMDLGIDMREESKSEKSSSKKSKDGDVLLEEGDLLALFQNATEVVKSESTKKKSKKSKQEDSPEKPISNVLNTSSDDKSAKEKSKKVKSQQSLEEMNASSSGELNSVGKKKRKSKAENSSEEQISILDESNTEITVDESGGSSTKKKKKKRKSKNCEELNDISVNVEGNELDSSTAEGSKKSSKKTETLVTESTIDSGVDGGQSGKILKRLEGSFIKEKLEEPGMVDNAGKKSKRKESINEDFTCKSCREVVRVSKSQQEAGRVDMTEDGYLCEACRERERASRSQLDDSSSSKQRTLAPDVGFVWDAKPDLLPAVARSKVDVESSSEEDEDTEKIKKKKKKLTPAEKRELARQEENRLREVEQQLMDSERNPQSADDFDRLVLASPNNSMYWIKYMAFHLQATEIEKARAVADRALKTISFREEQEKLNVWVALLNLENLYGTKESLDKTLQDAVQMNDAFKVYIQMLQIYAESSKIQEADKLSHLLSKKFRERKDMWLQAGEILMKFKLLEKARALMQKALGALENKEHVEVIMKFAQLENKFGEAERAQTLMEHILTSYPKRVDVWSSYVDMLVKSGLLDLARQVLERAVVQKLPVRKMKVLFKKFLQFEEQHGTPEGAEKVRQMAQDYVNSSTNVDEPDN